MSPRKDARHIRNVTTTRLSTEGSRSRAPTSFSKSTGIAGAVVALAPRNEKVRTILGGGQPGHRCDRPVAAMDALRDRAEGTLVYRRVIVHADESVHLTAPDLTPSARGKPGSRGSRLTGRS